MGIWLIRAIRADYQIKRCPLPVRSAIVRRYGLQAWEYRILAFRRGDRCSDGACLKSAARGKCLKQPGFEVQIPLMLFSFGEVYLTELFRTVVITENRIAKLFTGQVKAATVDNIKAMEVAISERDTIDAAAEDVLHEKGGDGTLTQCPVFG